MEEVTYSVVDVEQFNMQYGRRTVITFKSVITGAEHTVYGPKCLTKHFLNNKGDLDVKKVQMFKQIRVTYKGYKAESKWTSYNFEFHH